LSHRYLSTSAILSHHSRVNPHILLWFIELFISIVQSSVDHSIMSKVCPNFRSPDLATCCCKSTRVYFLLTANEYYMPYTIKISITVISTKIFLTYAPCTNFVILALDAFNAPAPAIQIDTLIPVLVQRRHCRTSSWPGIYDHRVPRPPNC